MATKTLETWSKKDNKNENPTGMVIENLQEQQATAEVKQANKQPDSDDIESLPDNNNDSFSNESAISDMYRESTDLFGILFVPLFVRKSSFERELESRIHLA